MINKLTLGLICDLLNIPEHGIITSEMTTTSDVELLLEVLLEVGGVLRLVCPWLIIYSH